MKRCAAILVFVASFLAGCGVVISDFPGNPVTPSQALNGSWLVSGDLGTATAFLSTNADGLAVEIRAKSREQLHMSAKLFDWHGKHYVVLADNKGMPPDMVLLEVQGMNADTLRLVSLNPALTRERLLKLERKPVVRERGVLEEIVLSRADVEALLAGPPGKVFDGGAVVELKRNGSGPEN